MSRLARILFVIWFLTPITVSAQTSLREFDIKPVQSGRLPVFTRHPDKAAVIFNSSLTNLRFDSNLEIIEILGDATQGEYILIVNPVRQIISVSASGFQQGRIPITLNQPRQVAYFSVEPKDRVITERGNLIVRTEPAGAMVRIDGIPGEFRSPHTFEGILAISHTLVIRLDDYQVEERLVRVEPGRPTVETIRMTPNFGFLLIREEGLELFLKTADDPQEFRVSYTPNTPLKRPIGAYSYRLVKPFYRAAIDTVTVRPGLTSEVKPTFVADFSTLRVRTNAPAVSLSSVDNRAPQSTTSGTIFLEQGQREVLVESAGFAPIRLNLRSVAGTTVDTTLTMLTSAQAGDLARREALPKGILQLAADVDAEIYVNGQREGTMQTTLTLIPGTYSVEFRHPLKTESFSVDIPSADLVVRQVYLRPSKSKAMIRAALIAGGGHIYTKQSRGYVYLGAMAGALTFSVLQNVRVGELTKDYDEYLRQYRSTQSVAEASSYRQLLLQAREDANLAIRMTGYGLLAAAGVHVVQLIDLNLSSPKYGYQSKQRPFSLSLASNGLSLTYRLP
jgi:hypothetical protein